MKPFLITTMTAAALLASISFAAADETEGRITQVNLEEQTITLDNGMTFTLSDDVNVNALAAGQEVKVTFEKQDSENIATGVESPQN